MKITKVETIRLDEFPNIIWIRLHTDEGLVGLGETFMGARAVEAHVHEWAAQRLLGQDPMAIELLNRRITGYLGWRGSGAETRGNSAVDIALWDIFGKATNLPICKALGGKSRDSIRIYNTCAGYQYVRGNQNQSSSNWGLGLPQGPYEDLEGILNHADELALSLISEGITGMKIWPFDLAAECSGGQYISPANSTSRSNRFTRSARRSATRWTSWSNFTACGACRWPGRSPRPYSLSTPSGTKTRSAWTAWTRCANMRSTARP